MSEKAKQTAIKWFLVLLIVLVSAITVYIREHKLESEYNNGVGVYESNQGVTQSGAKGLYGKIIDELKNN